MSLSFATFSYTCATFTSFRPTTHNLPHVCAHTPTHPHRLHLLLTIPRALVHSAMGAVLFKIVQVGRGDGRARSHHMRVYIVYLAGTGARSPPRALDSAGRVGARVRVRVRCWFRHWRWNFNLYVASLLWSAVLLGRADPFVDTDALTSHAAADGLLQRRRRTSIGCHRARQPLHWCRRWPRVH